MQRPDRVAEITGNGILHYAHITRRAQAALGAKLSLAAASSGEPVYTRRIEVLFKLRVVALRARRILFSLEPVSYTHMTLPTILLV